MNSTMRQVGSALGVAVLGTVLNSTYIANVTAIQWPVQLPPQALDAIRNSIQGAHIVAQSVQNPQLSQMIVQKSSEAFTSGSERALVIASIVMLVSAVLTLFILPNKIRPPEGVRAAK